MYWQPVPIGWRDAPSVLSLGAAIGEADPRLLLIDLWEWALQHGREHPAEMAPSVIETAAGWRGERGALFAGLVKSGWVVEADGVAVILKWEAHITARHIDAKLTDGMTKEERIKAKSAIRSKNYRDRKAIENASRSVTLHHASSRSVTRDASRPTVTQTVTQEFATDAIQHETRRINSVTLPSRSRHASRTEVEVEVDIDQVPKNLALFEIRKGAGEVEQPKPRRGRPPKDRSPEAEAERLAEKADADRWLEAARKLTGAEPGVLRWGDQLFLKFRRARKARGIDQLLRALEGLESDPFSKTAGLGWLVSEAGISKGLLKAAAPTRTGSLDLSKMDYSTWDEI